MKVVIPVIKSTRTEDANDQPVFVRQEVHTAIEEALSCDCEEIILVSDRPNGGPDAQYGDGFEAVGWHRPQGAEDTAKIRLIRHEGPISIGKAILAAAPYLDGSPFMVVLGDAPTPSGVPSLRELVAVHHETAGAVLAVRPLTQDDGRLGTVDVGHGGGRLHPVLDLFDTPLPPHVPTQRAILGRFVFTQDIAEALLLAKGGEAPEATLVGALKQAIAQSPVYAIEPNRGTEPRTTHAAARAARGLGTSGRETVATDLIAASGA